MMRYSRIKIEIILFALSMCTIVYPLIRFNNNYTNNDFIHITPGLYRTVEGTVPAVYGVSLNSLLYEIEFIILYELTGLSVDEMLLFALPLTVGFAVIIVLYLFVRQFLDDLHSLVAVAALIVTPIIVAFRMTGKHSIFTYSIFFLFIYVVFRSSGKKWNLLRLVIGISLALYHIYISIAAVIILLGIEFCRSALDIRNYLKPNIVVSQLLIGVSTISYILLTPLSLRRLLTGVLPPYPTANADSSLSSSAPTATSGIEQYIRLLTLRWDPWWIWFILSFPMLLILLLGGIYWIKSTANFNYHSSVSITYVLATCFGIFGIVSLILGMIGYSSTNLIFRYLVYFIPICVLFLLDKIPMRDLLTNNYFMIIVIFLLVSGLVVAPVKSSAEPTIQEVRWGSYKHSQDSALKWSNIHVDRFGVTSIRIATAIFYIEFDTYKSISELPIYECSPDTDKCLINSKTTQAHDGNKVYTNSDSYLIIKSSNRVY